MVSFFLKVRNIFNPPGDEITFESFVQFSLVMLRMLFFDFEPLIENASFKKKVEYYSRMAFFAFCLLCSVVIFYQLIAYAVLHSDDFEALAAAVPDMSTIFLMFIKAFLTFLHKNEIWEIFEELKALFNRRESAFAKQKTLQCFKGYNRVIKVYAAVFAALFLQLLYPWVRFFIYGTMKLDTNLWFPFDAFTAKNFPFALFWTNWIVYSHCIFLLAAESLLYSLVTVIAMEFDILKNDFKGLRLEPKEEGKKIFSRLIDRHNKLLEIADKLQGVYSLTFLYSFVVSSVVMCCKVFLLVTIKADLAHLGYHIFYFGMVSGQIWLLCLFGQKLIDSSIGVADGAYDCEWMSLDDNYFKKQISLAVLRARKPKSLNANKFAEISLETFAAVKLLKFLSTL